MKTFTNYINQKNLDIVMSEVAMKMAESNIDPYQFLIDYYKNQPEVVMQLEAHKEENLHEFMQGFKNMASAAWNAAKGVGQNLSTAGQALGQGLASTGKQLRDDAFGPEAKYKVALQAVKALTNELGKNQELQMAMQNDQSGQTKKVIDDLIRISQELEKQQELVGNYLRRNKEQPSNFYTTANRGANPGSQVPSPEAPNNWSDQVDAFMGT
jgi:hypothetical protein